MGLLLLIAPLAVVLSPYLLVKGLFDAASATFTDLITIWTNFFA